MALKLSFTSSIKNFLINLIERPLLGIPFRIFGCCTRKKPKILGFINPFYSESFIFERDNSYFISDTGTYIAQESKRDGAVKLDPTRFEPEIDFLMKLLVKQDSNVLDIGANVGFHTVRLAQRATSGRVYAFEASPCAIHKLNKNCAFNNLKNVTIIPHALGNLTEIKKININKTGDGLEGTSSFLTTHHIQREPNLYDQTDVQIYRLDDLIDQLEIQKIDFVKIDVEGFEPMVIEGGLEALQRHRPIIITEAHSVRLSNTEKSFSWYLKTFPDYHIFVIYPISRANPYLRFKPLSGKESEIAVNLLLLPQLNSFNPHVAKS